MKRRLNKDEIRRYANKIGRSAYKKIIKIIDRELNDIPERNNIDFNDIVNVILIALSAVDASVLKNLSSAYENVTKKPIDMDKMIQNFTGNFLLSLGKEPDTKDVIH